MASSGRIFAFGLVTGLVIGAAIGALVIRSGIWPHRGPTKAVRDARVLTMTPKQFPARCGKLIRDKLRYSDMLAVELPVRHKRPPFDERDVTVALTLPNGTVQNVTAEFLHAPDSHAKPYWKLDSVGGYDTGTSALGGLKTIEELYPCTAE